MLNVSETLKSIMSEYGLNQTMLSRATGYDHSNISRWCNGVRKPDIDTLEHILSHFGYELSVGQSSKENSKKPTSFYFDKSYNQLKSMSDEDLADYVFVTQDEEVLAWALGTPEYILEYMPLENQRKALMSQVDSINRLSLYFKINNMHTDMEEELGIFIEGVKEYLENNPSIPKEILSETKYFAFEVHLHYQGDPEEYYSINEFKLLDEDRYYLDINSKNIDGEGKGLDIYLANKLGNVSFYMLCKYFAEYEYDHDYYNEFDVLVNLNY